MRLSSSLDDQAILDDIAYSMGRCAMDGSRTVVSGLAGLHKVVWRVDRQWKPPHVIAQLIAP